MEVMKPRMNSGFRLSKRPAAINRFQIVIAMLAAFFLSQPLIEVNAQSEGQKRPAQKLVVKVVDETGVAVSDARLILKQSATQLVVRGQTDAGGIYEFSSLDPDSYELRIEKKGFYASTTADFRVVETQTLEVTIYHQQEIAETVDVKVSPPAIDPEETALSQTVTSREILTLPYPSTRDYRKALPLIPGVLADTSDQIHLGGSATYQVLDELDGFNIRHPVSGLLELRLSPDVLRTIDVQTSRLSAEHGKGSGGILRLTTGMGDDRYRFSATNFLPSFQNTRGLNISDWTPRATFSGPLRKKKAWFYNGVGAVYKLEIVPQLPSNADRTTSLLVHNLLKGQVNLSQRHILTTSFLINSSNTRRNGLSQFNPAETTTTLDESAYLVSLKEQFYSANGGLVEVGFAVNQFHSAEQPMGDLPFRLTPAGPSGNFFRTSAATTRRFQWIGNFSLPSVRSHEIKFGIDLDLITLDQSVARRPIFIERRDGTVAREIAFTGGTASRRRNFESSAYVQDRWSISKSLLLEAGVRFDRDTIIKRLSVSPRLGATYLVRGRGNSKLSGGIGLYYDATNLDFVSRSLMEQRVDQFYAADGTPAGPPLATFFQVNEKNLKVPRYLNWSVGLEQELPGETYLGIEFMQKHGRNVFAFFNVDGTGHSGGGFSLGNARRDGYDGLQVTLRRAFKDNYSMLVSYIRSRARADAVFEPSIDNPVFAQQAGGPLPWDTPNRLIFWGWVPLIKKFDLAYSLDWRNGFPFSVVNEQQQLVGTPNSRRFPAYFTLNPHVERRFSLLGQYLALRAGFNNVTNRQNPSLVNNNIDSPQFLTFGGTQHRAFTGRIRFLGRK